MGTLVRVNHDKPPSRPKSFHTSSAKDDQGQTFWPKYGVVKFAASPSFWKQWAARGLRSHSQLNACPTEPPFLPKWATAETIISAEVRLSSVVVGMTIL